MIALMTVFCKNKKGQLVKTINIMTKDPEAAAQEYKKDCAHVYAHVHTYKEGLEGRYTISL